MNRQSSLPSCNQQSSGKTHGRDDPLLFGTMPQDWLRAAARLPGKSMQLAVLIWCAAHLSNRRAVSISNIDALGFGLE